MVSHCSLGSGASKVAQSGVESKYFHDNFVSCDREISITSRVAGGFNV